MMKFRNLRANAGSRSASSASRSSRAICSASRAGSEGGRPCCGLEHADRLGVLEALGQREDEDRVQPVDRLAVPAQEVGGAADGVGAVIAGPPAAGWR